MNCYDRGTPFSPLDPLLPVSFDITSLLAGWPYKPDEVSVRIVPGNDGRDKMQLRLDLGMLQMEIDGRPDGQRIHGVESWLEYHRQQQEKHDAAHPDGAPYLLATEDCAELMREGVQYYHRYLSFWQIQRYELCARDTQRNLKLFRFVREHAKYDRDKLQFDQWRPYVTMMHARAVATPLVELEQYAAAISAVDAGIRGIEQFLSDYGQQEQAGRLGELTFLVRWKREIAQLAGDIAAENEETEDPVAAVEAKLAAAIEEERYEEAISLRDELKKLKDPPPPGGLPGVG